MALKMVFHEISANARTQIAGMMVVYATLMFFNMAIARVLTPEELGIHSLGVTFFSIGSIACLMGLDQSLVRFVAESTALGQQSRIKGLLLLAVGLVGIASTLFAFGLLFFAEEISEFLGKPGLSAPLVFYGLAVIPAGMAGALSAAFMGMKEVKKSVSIVVVSTLLQAGAGIALVFNFRVTGIAFSLFVGWALALAVALVLAARSLPRCTQRDFTAAGSMIGFTAPVWLASLFSLALTWANRIVLGADLPAAYLALFHVGVAVPTALSAAFLSSFMQVLFPYTTEGFATDFVGAVEMITRLSRVFFAICIIALPPLILVADIIMFTVFSERYLGSALIFQIVMLAFPFSFLIGLDQRVLYSLGNSLFELKRLALTACVSLALYVLVVPSFGVMGAAVVLLFSQVMYAFIGLVYLDLRYGIRRDIGLLCAGFAYPAAFVFATEFMRALLGTGALLAAEGILAVSAFALSVAFVRWLRVLSAEDVQLVNVFVQKFVPFRSDGIVTRLLSAG